MCAHARYVCHSAALASSPASPDIPPLLCRVPRSVSCHTNAAVLLDAMYEHSQRLRLQMRREVDLLYELWAASLEPEAKWKVRRGMGAGAGPGACCWQRVMC
jgi:hypothetical protein